MTDYCYDLHSHTTMSDGHLTPSELVRYAVLQKVDFLAITDHDTLAALPLARQTIATEKLPLQLISGVEISTLWQRHEIHIVGLQIMEENASLQTFLQQQQQYRLQRAQQIAAKLTALGVPDAWQGASQLAAGGNVTRHHFARYLLAQGKVKTMDQAFKRYLAKGAKAYVAPQWPALTEVVAVINQAQGCAVLAHPLRYDLSDKWVKRLIADFVAYGGQALEVANSQQAPEQRRKLTQWAIDHQLAASVGSDFHYHSPWRELGRNLTLAESLQPVWQRW